MKIETLQNLLHTKGVVVYMAHPFGGSWHKSRGCRSEKNYAETRGMLVAQLNEDRTLRWVG